MSHRLHVAHLRAVAARNGDTSDYKIAKRTGVSRAAVSRLVNLKVEPTVSTLMRFVACYGGAVEDYIRPTQPEPAPEREPALTA